jgi:hypothetical protein
VAKKTAVPPSSPEGCPGSSKAGPEPGNDKNPEEIMSQSLTHLYRQIDETREYCFNIASATPLSREELDCLRLILADGFLIDTVTDQASLKGEQCCRSRPPAQFCHRLVLQSGFHLSGNRV